MTSSKPHYLNDRRAIAITMKAKRFVNSFVVFIYSFTDSNIKCPFALSKGRGERKEERISLANGPSFPMRPAPGSHSWPLRLCTSSTQRDVDSNEFPLQKTGWLE